MERVVNDDVTTVCPDCGGAFVLDEAQNPDRVIDRMKRNAEKAGTAMRKAEQIREKVARVGLLMRCVLCGYRTRQHPPAEAEAEHASDGAALPGAPARGALPPKPAATPGRRGLPAASGEAGAGRS